jgi:predicted DNA-binding protein
MRETKTTYLQIRMSETEKAELKDVAETLERPMTDIISEGINHRISILKRTQAFREAKKQQEPATVN